jgi:putative transposase
MRVVGSVGKYTKPGNTFRAVPHKVYPYLLPNLEVTESNQVWCTDITYILMR